MRHLIKLFVCFVCVLTLPASAAKPDNETASEMMNRLVSLHESLDLKSFSELSDKILDDVARDISFTSLSPEKMINKHESPNLFVGDKSKYDSAITKEKAAKVSAHFFGRPAPLTDEGEYIYGYAHDGALLCNAKIESVTEESDNTALIRAVLMCEPEPNVKAKHEGDLEMRVKELKNAPLGWTVISFTVNKN